jgi:hypothetical protein
VNLVETTEFEVLRPLNVVDYLRTHGWTTVSSTTDVAVLKLVTERGEVLTRVPLDESFGDYGRRMAELADMLSRLESRPVAQVVNDLGTPPGDLVRFRLASEETESGSLGLTQSLQLRRAIKNLLLSSAHAAIAPASSFARLTQQKALALFDACRERQSERGSYVTSLFVPVQPPVGQPSSLDDEFGRKTTRLLFRSLSVAERGAVDPDSLMRAQSDGVSSNFLEALSDLEPPGPRGALEVSVNWLGHSPAPDFTRTIRFSQASFRHYRQVARALREASPVPNSEIKGYVIHVEKWPGAEHGRVTVAATLEGYGECRVHVPVDQAQHQLAGQAHVDGRKVRLVGSLVKSGRTLELRQHSGVEVLTLDE